MSFWFHIDDEKMGPLQSDQIADLIRRGKLTSDTLAWRQGMQDWVRSADLVDLTSVFPELKGTTFVTHSRVEASSTVSQLDLADFGVRFTAGIIDTVILIIASLLIERIVSGVGTIGAFAGYYIMLMSRQGGGQTLGYKAMRIRLIDENSGLPPTLSSALVWYLVFSFAGIVGWIWFFRDNKRRMLHNIASKTIVVRLKG